MARDYSGFLYGALSDIGDTITKRRQEEELKLQDAQGNEAILNALGAGGSWIDTVNAKPQMQSGGGLSQYANAIAKTESGGRYDALGPVTKTGDRAYGKYQVMGANIPEWSKMYLGREVSPQEFVANPELQDKIFQGRFGEYVKRYGPEGAAKAWFAGEGGMNNPNAKDQLGTSVADYASKFNKNLGVQVASNDPNFVPQMAQAAPQAQQGYAPSQNGLPPREVMRQLLANPTTRPLAIELAKNAMSGKDNSMKWGEIGKDENGSVTYGFINERTGQVTPYQSPGGSGAPRPPRAKFSDVTSARKDFENQPGVSRFREAAPIVASMAQSVDNNTAMADMDFIYGLAKILDPNSVVREGELQLTSGNQAMDSQIKGYFAKAISGQGQLQPSVRRDLLKVAMTRAGEYRKQAEREVQQFSELATEYGADPRFVVRPLEQLPEMQQQQQQDPLGIR